MDSTEFDQTRLGWVHFASLNCILSSLKGTGSKTTTPEDHSVHVFKHPRASFLGLPAELRLQIYTHTADSLHFHIDVPISNRDRFFYRSVRNRKARLCNAPDALYGQLCSRPSFSGLEPKERLCYSQPPSSSDPFALRSTCRWIYEETKEILEKSRIGVTAEAEFARGVICMLKPDMRQSLTRLTILQATHSWSYSDIHSVVSWLCVYSSKLPSLRTLAVQTPLPHYKFCVKRPGSKLYPQFAPAQTWHKVWFVKALHEAFEGRVTVILDAWVVARAGYRENKSVLDEIVVMRGIAWSKGHVVQQEDVEFEIVRRQKVVEMEEKAEWKTWWKNNDLGYGRKPS